MFIVVKWGGRSFLCFGELFSVLFCIFVIYKANGLYGKE